VVARVDGAPVDRQHVADEGEGSLRLEADEELVP
jgi:hypothetical protein